MDLSGVRIVYEKLIWKRAKGDERLKVGTESSEVVTVVVQQLRLLASSAGDIGSIPDQATEMPHGA